jgi:hypothetical protein
MAEKLPFFTLTTAKKTAKITLIITLVFEKNANSSPKMEQ